MFSPLLPKSEGSLNTSINLSTAFKTPNENLLNVQNSIALGIEKFSSTADVDHNLQSLVAPPSELESRREENLGTRGDAMSPSKSFKTQPAISSSSRSLCSERTPRKVSSPEKRFPIKVNTSPLKRPAPREQALSFKDAFTNNTGRGAKIEIFEDESSGKEFGIRMHSLEDTVSTIDAVEGEEVDGFADETAFSTFSAVADMTMFAAAENSPMKYNSISKTPRFIVSSKIEAQNKFESSESLSPSRSFNVHTPRALPGAHKTENTTNLILDFTEQFNSFSDYAVTFPAKSNRRSPTKSQTGAQLAMDDQRTRTPSPMKRQTTAHSPSDRVSNLLDFDIPPAPTPQSLPSITPRELETLKSAFLSEISSLKASLSGKNAEIQSLKTAINDAEERVGESIQQVREERSLKECLALEKDEWEKRSHETALVVRNVKEELAKSERNREISDGRLEECEKKREAAEIMAQEAESKIAALRASSAISSERDGDSQRPPGNSAAKDVELAVEKVARELHTLYKSKHETKVSALKKSYEGRWGKKVKELEDKIEELAKENEELRLGHDTTMSSILPRISSTDDHDNFQNHATTEALTVKALENRLRTLTEELNTIRSDNDNLHNQLLAERTEKGDLVAACDELLALQDDIPASNLGVVSGVENLRGVTSKASALRPPTVSNAASIVTQLGEVRTIKMERSRSSSTHGVRPLSGFGQKHCIMSSIEKMGNHKGRGGE